MNRSVEKSRSLEIANQLLDKDEMIDVIATFNDVQTKILVTDDAATLIYPPEYLNIGIRGKIEAVENILMLSPTKFTTVELAAILGNEPLNITLADFKTTVILKQPQKFTGKDTLIGILGTGIDYTNMAFMDNDGKTRIEGIWDQTIGNESVYGYGTTYNSEMIDDALRGPDPFSIIPHKDEIGQGTMLAGIAAGSATYTEGPYTGVATQARLIVVKLKPASPTLQRIYHTKYNPLGFSALDIALAVQYIANIATELEKPVSICFPLGTNTGQHDASDSLSDIMGAYASNRGICMVLGAGEEANKGHHASGNLKDNNMQQVHLVIPKGQGGFIVEIWAAFGDKIEASLTTPQPSTTMVLNERRNNILNNGRSVWADGSKIDTKTGSQLIKFRLDNPQEGDWILSIKGIIIMNGYYNIWIPKTGMILPRTVLSPSSPFVTIYNSSASDGGVTVGCYDKIASSASAESGRGFTRDNRVKPDFLVEGINILAPLPEHEFGYITGTDAASAITTGVCALLYEKQLQQGTLLVNTAIMRALLIAELTRDQTMTYPDPSKGYGVLDIDTFSYK